MPSSIQIGMVPFLFISTINLIVVFSIGMIVGWILNERKR